MTTPFTHHDIQIVVDQFYRRVRSDEVLGPIFHTHIGTRDDDWQPHLQKIQSFWANVMMQERVYSGNPMQKHVQIPEIQGEHFEIWLDLFEDTLRELLPVEKADVFNHTARRIGRSLRMGLERANHPNRPPDLRMFSST